jgi:hypothetical protein
MKAQPAPVVAEVLRTWLRSRLGGELIPDIGPTLAVEEEVGSRGVDVARRADRRATSAASLGSLT